MKLFSYVVARDYGFAPNPFYGFCTLATCKPVIRRAAQVGDWVIGTGAGRQAGQLVFGMLVTEVLTFNEYWEDPRFQRKKPYFLGSRKQAFGDNIYFKFRGTGKWHQENSHHSYADGSPNHRNIGHDTQADRVLVSNDFVYWGGSGPEIPPDVCRELCKQGPGHKGRYSEAFVCKVIRWVRSQGVQGYAGAPLDWTRTV